MIDKENFKKVANYLATVPEDKFDMNFILKDDNSIIRINEFNPNNCNTVGCIVGHSYYLFYDVIEKLLKDKKYNKLISEKYYKKVFGFDDTHPYWNFIFSEHWSYTNKSDIEAAIKRINLLCNDKFREGLDKFIDKFNAENKDLFFEDIEDSSMVEIFNDYIDD